jgi:WD40 repeat protein
MAQERKNEDAAYATLASGEVGVDLDTPSPPVRSGARALSPGDVVDRYVVEELLGEGASAWVFRVRHETLGTRHALKLLKDPSEGMSARHLNEGKTLARWEHPHIVKVLDAFAMSEGTALVLELVDGATLEDLLARGPIDLELAEALFRQLVDAVGYAHERGVIHRDLKPANVLMSQAGHAKVSDFGIAKNTSFELTSDLLLTKTGHALGTPAYMAPEQVDASHEVDARADLFSLGVILFEMLCGARPYTGRTVWELLSAMRRGDHPDVRALCPEAPERLARAVDACLQPDPGARIPSAAALLGVLDGAAWVPAAPAQAAVGAQVPARRWPVYLASGLALVGLFASLGSMWSAREERARFAREVDEVERAGARRLEVEGERLELERRAWRATRGDPAAALALFRASASLAADPAAELTRPEVLELPGRGALARVLPTAHQPMWMEASAERDMLAASMLDGTLQTWRVSTGELLRTVDTRHSGGRRALSVNASFTRIAQEMPPASGTLRQPRPIKVFDLGTGELAYTPSYGQHMFLAGFRGGSDELVTFSRVGEGQLPGRERLRLAVSLWDGMFGAFERTIDVADDVFRHSASALSPDGNQAVLLNFEVLEMNWVDLDGGGSTRTRHPFEGENVEGRQTVAFTPDGARVITAMSGRVSAFDAKTRRMIEAHPRRTGQLFALDSEGALGVSGSYGGGLDVWALGVDATLGEVTPRRGSVMDAHVLDRSGYVVTASTEDEVELWAASGERVAAWPGHGAWVLSLGSWSDGAGEWLMSGGREHTLRVTDTRALGARAHRATALLGARGLEWSPAGERAAGWVGGELRVWDVARARVSHAFEGVAPDGITWSPGGDLYTHRRTAVRATEWCRYDLDRGAQAWCVEAPAWVRMHDHVGGGVVHCDPAKCFFLSGEGEVSADVLKWSATSEQLPSIALMGAVTPDAFVYASSGGEVWVLGGVGEGGRARALDVRLPNVARIEPTRGGFVLGGWEGALERWEMKAREPSWHVELGAGVSAVDETADGATLAVALMDGRVVLLDARTGAVTRALAGPVKEAVELAISAGGDQVAVTTKAGVIWVWSARTGDVLAMWVAPPGRGRLGFTASGELERHGERGEVRRWPDAPTLAARPWMVRLGEGSNLRVCRSSGEVVPVLPYPDPEAVWAPESECPALGDPTNAR